MKWAIRSDPLFFIIGTLFAQPVLAVTFSGSDYVVGSSPFAITTGDFNKDDELKGSEPFF